MKYFEFDRLRRVIELSDPSSVLDTEGRVKDVNRHTVYMRHPDSGTWSRVVKIASEYIDLEIGQSDLNSKSTTVREPWYLHRRIPLSDVAIHLRFARKDLVPTQVLGELSGQDAVYRAWKISFWKYKRSFLWFLDLLKLRLFLLRRRADTEHWDFVGVLISLQNRGVKDLTVSRFLSAQYGHIWASSPDRNRDFNIALNRLNALVKNGVIVSGFRDGRLLSVSETTLSGYADYRTDERRYRGIRLTNWLMVVVTVALVVLTYKAL